VNGLRSVDFFQRFVRREAAVAKPKILLPQSSEHQNVHTYQETLVSTGARERSYIDMLKGHINRHTLLDTEFSDLRCAAVGTPEVQLYLNRLIGRMTTESAKKIRVTLSQIFKFGTQVGFVGTNPVRDAEIKQRNRPDAGAESDFVLPSKTSLRALLDGAATFDNTGRASAVAHVRVARFTSPLLPLGGR
jgi:hypothetical protein